MSAVAEAQLAVDASELAEVECDWVSPDAADCPRPVLWLGDLPCGDQTLACAAHHAAIRALEGTHCFGCGDHLHDNEDIAWRPV